MTLLLDWDGTLHNSLHLYGAAFRCAYAWLAEAGFVPARAYSDQEVSVYLGMNAAEMWDTFMPGLPQTVKREASDRLGREMVRRVQAGEAVLYTGVPAVLDRLKADGHILVFLSNCKHAYMEAHRQYFQLDRWFSGFFCCQDYGNRPKEEIFPEIAARFPGPYAVIGDRETDFRVAQAHGLYCIGCAYGFGTPEELRMADAVVSSCAEIPALLARSPRPDGSDVP